MAWEFEMAAGPFNPRLTEGPAWDGQALLFTHIPASRILRYDPQTGACTVFREHTNHTNGLQTSPEFPLRIWLGKPTLGRGQKRGSEQLS
jgi:sugar lactone lactonase YvrE